MDAGDLQIAHQETRAQEDDQQIDCEGRVDEEGSGRGRWDADITRQLPVTEAGWLGRPCLQAVVAVNLQGKRQLSGGGGVCTFC